MDLFGQPAMNNAYLICHNIQVNVSNRNSYDDHLITIDKCWVLLGFSVLAWLQISQGPKEGKEEKKGEKINDDLKLDDSFLAAKTQLNKS